MLLCFRRQYIVLTRCFCRREIFVKLFGEVVSGVIDSGIPFGGEGELVMFITVVALLSVAATAIT